MEMTQKEGKSKSYRNIIVHAPKLENEKFTKISIVLALVNAFCPDTHTATDARLWLF